MHRIVASLVLILFVCGAGYAQDRGCTDSDSNQAESEAETLRTWDSLYKSYSLYRSCDDGAVAEGYSESVARILADHWNTLSRLAELAKTNDRFFHFVLRHIDTTDDEKDLRKISVKASTQCPPGLQDMCRDLKKAADSAVKENAAAPRANDACDLPRDLQHEIGVHYPDAKLVRLPDLSKDDSALFEKEHGNSCPGLVKVDLYGDGTSTLALVLMTGQGANEKAELIVAHEVHGNWRTTLLDTADSSAPVVWSQGPGEYRDIYGEKTIRATRSVIVFCGYYGWAIVYAWTGKSVTKVWLED
jgi:hypothetical protein